MIEGEMMAKKFKYGYYLDEFGRKQPKRKMGFMYGFGWARHHKEDERKLRQSPYVNTWKGKVSDIGDGDTHYSTLWMARIGYRIGRWIK